MILIIWKLNRKAGFEVSKSQGITKGLFFKMNNRFTQINQKAPAQNLETSIRLILLLVLLGSLYFIFAWSTFNGLWYHKILCILSTLTFTYLCEQSYFELYEKRIKKDFPGTIKKLSHYYGHYGGNVIPALEDTALRCPRSNSIYILKIKEALLKPDYKRQIEELEDKMPTIWLKMLCRLIMFAKENGEAEEAVISNNLKRLANIVTFLNIEQEYNDAELLGMQFFVFFVPLLVIPVTGWYNANLLIGLDVADIYRSIEAQSMTAIMLFMSSLGALFIHWMRRLQN